MAQSRVIVVLACLCLTSCGFVVRVISRTSALPEEPARVAGRIEDPRRPDARLSVLWIGHATALVQMDDLFILTDPVFTRAVGGLSRRLVEPGLDPAALPPLAAVAISHTHLDHLSFDSLAMIEDKASILLLPPGAQASVPRYAFPSRELERWQTYEKGGLRVTAVPVRHVGGRWGIDLAWTARAFTGYVFEYHGLSVYFGGDTAFDARHFRTARQRFPNLELALLPICPAEPHDFMRHVHMNPAEALDALELLGARRMVPVHFDTFLNSDDEPGECTRKLRDAIGARKIARDRVVVLKIGEQRVFVAR